MRIPILDHGYLELVETWGSDERIVEAARMSTGKGFLGWDPGLCPVCFPDSYPANQPKIPINDCIACEGKGRINGDQALLRYLYTHNHATPFEMAGMVIEVQAPIFVFREWHRHRTQSYNEMSARYVPLPDINYIPTVDRLLMNAPETCDKCGQTGAMERFMTNPPTHMGCGGHVVRKPATNRQAGTIKGAPPMSLAASAENYQLHLRQMYEQQETFYQHALSIGVPKELARIHLPVGRYSRMRASANLRNWLAFLTLRTDSAAQWEIRQYAIAVQKLVAEHFARTHGLFVERKAA